MLALASPADSLRLEGESYQPTVRIIWAVTNQIPQSLMIYKVIPQQFSNTAISNLLKMASFKPATMKLSSDKKTMSWRAYEDEGRRLVRSLDIAPACGYISYNDYQAAPISSTAPPVNVPTYEKVEKLTMECLRQLGGDTNQISWRPKSRTLGHRTLYNKPPWKGGHETNEQIEMRGVILCRQIDGIRFCGPGGRGGISIDFGNNAKVSRLELSWRNLQPYKRYKTTSQKEIVTMIKKGKAVLPFPQDADLTDLPQAKKLTITKITPYLWGEIGPASQDFVYPFTEFQMTADLGGTNTLNFVLDCPVIDETQPLSPAGKNNSP